MSLICNVSNISRGSLHDGHGIRTVIYFKGCPLRCKWCHNPETFTGGKTLIYAPVKCIGCGDCVKMCPECHKPGADKMILNRDKCTNCGKCADVCPTGALSVCGENITVDELFEIILKDSHYYRESGGGVTLSGGECLIQADFAAQLLKKCREAGIDTAIESSFFVPFKYILKVAEFTNLIFVDLKHHNSQKHKEYTGRGNELIIDNICKCSNIHDNIIIRIPLIPGVNDGEEDMMKFAEIIRTFGAGVKKVELLKYNYLAESKYQSVGLSYTSYGKETQSSKRLQKLAEILRKSINIDVIFSE